MAGSSKEQAALGSQQFRSSPQAITRRFLAVWSLGHGRSAAMRRARIRLSALVRRRLCQASIVAAENAVRDLGDEVESNLERIANSVKTWVARVRFSASYRTARIYCVFRRVPDSCCKRRIADDGHERHFA